MMGINNGKRYPMNIDISQITDDQILDFIPLTDARYYENIQRQVKNGIVIQFKDNSWAIIILSGSEFPRLPNKPLPSFTPTDFSEKGERRENLRAKQGRLLTTNPNARASMIQTRAKTRDYRGYIPQGEMPGMDFTVIDQGDVYNPKNGWRWKPLKHN